ncbi:alkaline phosphatase D family protein [Photobacterium japonica]|uniref:alkaline phosphatase D family protein n=1 Tax=Photobacterium japonica TaxID=2910235 RepID=UPI003D09CAD7
MKRRDFIRCLTVGSSAGIVTSAFAHTQTPSAIEQSETMATPRVYGGFTHGVASGDPLSDRVILWTRFVPDAFLKIDEVIVHWEMATDKRFSKNYQSGDALARQASDFIVKVDAANLLPNKKYYYRFSVDFIQSVTGVTKTLPVKHVEKVSFAIATCANHPAGYFNVYREIVRQHKRKQFDALLHIGDYIYEYGMGEYASDHAIELDRVPSPAHECITLTDYRKRYAQYRSDDDLQALHASMPFIHIWDDHEIADNTWKDGAFNHQPQEGDFVARREAAIQAFHEWLPIRDNMVAEGEIYRSFVYGDLVHLLMLDTRVTGRTEQLDYGNYSKADPQAAYDQLQKDLYADGHELLGEKQKQWIASELRNHSTRWTALGQQVLMTKMDVPFNLLLAFMGAKEAHRTRTPFDGNIIMDAARHPSILKSPYNLDAWDGYPRDRDWVYGQMNKYGKSFVSFAGDTHNAWAGELVNKQGNNCGVEFAASSVGSPGIEHYLPLPPKLMREIQKLFPELVTDLKWANIVDRGFMAVTFTQEEIDCEWIFVDKILSKDYSVLPITHASTEDALELDIDEEDGPDWEDIFGDVDLDDLLDD